MTDTFPIFGKTAGSHQMDLSSVSLIIFGWFLGLTSSRLKEVSNGTLCKIYGARKLKIWIFKVRGCAVTVANPRQLGCVCVEI